MMRYNEMTANVESTRSTVETNKMIRNTYMLLAMTMAFSTVTAAISMAINPPFIVFLGSMIGSFVMIFALNKLQNSVWALPVTFLFTGMMGFGLGPLLNHYLAMANGSEIVLSALGTTALTFFGLSAYVLTSKKDFSFMGGFLAAGMIVALISMVALWGMSFFGINISGLSLAFSAMIVMLMAGMILYDTSNIVNGVYTNYVMATVGLYLNIYNLFIHLLALFGFANDD